MASVSKVRISLRSDDLRNWESKNPILNNGELAIVRDANSNVRFKIGDGTTPFKLLSYVNENEIETDSAVVKSLAQGLKTKATPLGLAAGAFLSANADFSQALGYNAETKAGDTYAFVWNGDAERTLLDYYQSHGPGSFSINPADGLSGVYVGEQSLHSILNELSAAEDMKIGAVSSAVDKKIWIEDDIGHAISGNSNLSVIKLSEEDYYSRVIAGELNVSTLYIVENSSINAYGEKIVNVGEPELSSDAATKNYVDAEIAKIPAPDLSEYYKKTETSSASQIKTAIDSIDVSDQLSGYVKLSSDSEQSISSDVQVNGWLRVGNLNVAGSGGEARWGCIEGEVKDQHDLVDVNYPLDAPTQTSETVAGVTYKRFDVKDHHISTISLSDSTPARIHFPSKPAANFCRDFIVKIKVTAAEVPQVQFVKADNDASIGFEYVDDDWASLETGINYFTFTETERA